MGYVFISYSSKEQKQANFVCNLLREREIDYWIATEHILAGENYAKVIPSAIKKCSCVILLLSQASQQSDYVSNEIDRAINAKKPIFPIKLERCALNDEFDFYLCRCQIVNAFNIEEDAMPLDKILESIKVLTDQGKFVLAVPPTIELPVEIENKETSCIESILNRYGIHCKYFNKKFVGRLLVRYYFTTDLPLEKLQNLDKYYGDDIRLALQRVERTYFTIEKDENQTLICVEIARADRQIVQFEEVFDPLTLKNQGKLVFPLGVDFNNKIHFVDIVHDGNIIIDGTIGTGKSILLSNIIISLISLHTKEELRLLLFDPKQIELQAFKNLPHLLKPILFSQTESNDALDELYTLVSHRKKMFQSIGKYNIEQYNQIADKKLEYVVVIIDEINDLLDHNKKFQERLMRFAQISRYMGVYIIATSQRAHQKEYQDLFDNVFTSRIALRLVSLADSMAFLHEAGAERLLSNGDLYYYSQNDNSLTRLQAPYVSNEVIKEKIENSH